MRACTNHDSGRECTTCYGLVCHSCCQFLAGGQHPQNDLFIAWMEDHDPSLKAVCDRFGENWFVRCNRCEPAFWSVASKTDLGDGKWSIKYLDGGEFVGSIKSSGVRHGDGTYTCAEYTYTGQWKDSKMHGEGTYTYTVTGGPEKSYDGQWKENSKHGFGIFTWARGDVYVGEWVKGDCHGRGALITSDGQILRARFDHDEPVQRLPDPPLSAFSSGDRVMIGGFSTWSMEQGSGTPEHNCAYAVLEAYDRERGLWRLSIDAEPGTTYTVSTSHLVATGKQAALDAATSSLEAASLADGADA